MKTITSTTHTKTLEMVYIAIFAVIIAICSWISIPSAIPFTLQTFAVFISLGLLGGKRGSLAVLVWILLGSIGIPVFSGFSAGLGVLLGTTGGYIIGLLLGSLLYWLITTILGTKTPIMILSMVLALFVCYAFGTAWFLLVYTKTSGAISIVTALSWCVVPFILPDVLKILLAIILTKRLSRYVEL